MPGWMGAHATAEVERAISTKPSDKGPVEPDTKCNAALRSRGKLCGQPAGWGTDHPGIGRCKKHGGASPSYLGEVQRLAATRAVATYGLPVETNPHEALLQELMRTQGHVDWLRIQVGQLDVDTVAGPVGSEGTNDVGVHFHPRYEPDVMLRLYHTERKHLIAVAKACAEAGIEERRIRIAEEQGKLIATAITNVLKRLGVDMTDPEVPKVVRSELELLSAGEPVAA